MHDPSTGFDSPFAPTPVPPAMFRRERGARHVPRQRQPRPAVAPPIRQAMSSVTLGCPMAHGGLTVTPLIGDDDPACEYVTLEEALAREVVSVKEMFWEDTNRLCLSNRADEPLLIVDGEELAGSIQNRVVNLSMLVRTHNRVLIPVSCVEHGRAHGATLRFTSAPRIQFASGRAERIREVSRSLANEGERRGNQGRIWSSIARKCMELGARSATGAMAAIYERHATALTGYVDALRPVQRQRGAVFHLGGHPAGMELFDTAATWSRLHHKIVSSYAVEALDAKPVDAGEPDITATALLDLLGESRTCSYTTFGDGFDLRIVGPRVTAAALVFSARVIHLAAFVIPGMPPHEIAMPAVRPR